MERFIYKDQKKLRLGYTTGTCAAAAAKAASMMLLGGVPVRQIELVTPKGIPLKLAVEEILMRKDSVSCAVRKDAGDDPDVTDGVCIHACVTLTEKGFETDGGEGVGRVTKAGLDQPIGNAAINSVPRRMITEAMQEAA